MGDKPNLALGMLHTLTSVPGLDAAQHGELVDVTALRPLIVAADCDAGQEVAILGNATDAAITVTLPPVDGRSGRQYFVKKTDDSANAVTLDGNGNETIDGAATFALSAQYDYVHIVCDGTQWLILSKTPTLDHGGLAGLADDDHSQYLQVADFVSSLMNDQTQDDITGNTSYQDCSGTASITVAVTSTLLIEASFKFRTSRTDYQAAVRLVDSADANIGTTTAVTNQTDFQHWTIHARLTGKTAGTHTFNLMAQIAHASYHTYVDEKQIRILATPE